MLRTYSLKADGDKNLTAHFKVKEFACKDGSDCILIDDRLPIVLEYIRCRANKRLTIASGYRTVAYNEKVGGAEHSQHCLGTAADVTIPGGLNWDILHQFAREIMPNYGGTGKYATFIHVDVRDAKAEW